MRVEFFALQFHNFYSTCDTLRLYQWDRLEEALADSTKCPRLRNMCVEFSKHFEVE